MKGHRLEVADVFRVLQDQFLQRWGHALSDQQRKVLRDIGLCLESASAASSASALSRSRRRALDHSRWIATRRHGFFLPVRVLSRMFRGKLLSFLKQSYGRGELCFAGKVTALSTPRAFYTLLADLQRTEWVVYSKPPFGVPEHVLKYLARYTHRVAISNGSLLSLEDGQVRFCWRDSRRNNRSSVMRLDATEFIRRFLLHVLPAGFVKIRHFGLLANRNRRRALAPCRAHLCATARDLTALLNEQQKTALNRSCPQCRCGTLAVIARYSAGQAVAATAVHYGATADSS